jgi:hypothetical protein
MPDIFNALPGLEVPVGVIAKNLGEMWQDPTAASVPPFPAEAAKATQVNFVLHLGLNTTVDDAVEQFQTAVAFSKRCPSRVVVLCPLQADDEGPDMRAKIYGECHLGKTKSDKRCVEFVMLSYTRRARAFLENQVSICLSVDLPLYYWAHRFSKSANLATYHYLLTKAQCVIIDSATAPDDALKYAWPRRETLRDLVHYRLLPIRQSLGQFLSRYPMPVLCEGLQQVTLAHDADHGPEARVLLSWLEERITQCGEHRAAFVQTKLAAGQPGSFALTLAYAGGGKKFEWRGDLTQGTARFEADFGSGRTVLPAAISLLSPEAALAEAMFR